MSQFFVPSSGGGGGGTVTSVTGGNNITITGNPAVNPTVNVSGTTNHAVLIGNGTGSLTSITVGTTGQILTGVTGADPVFANNPAATSFITNPATGTATPSSGVITIAGAGTTTVSAAGSTITITSSGGGGVSSAFFAYFSTTANNVTGDATIYQCLPDTVVTNIGSDFTVGTGLYTAPTTGLYNFSFCLALTGIVAETNATIIFNATGANYYSVILNPQGLITGGVLAYSGSVGPLPLTAGDTIGLELQVSGGTKTVNVFGDASPNLFSYFAGNFIG